jgi:hypothetical protein
VKTKQKQSLVPLNTPHFPRQYCQCTTFLEMRLFASQASNQAETSLSRASRVAAERAIGAPSRGRALGFVPFASFVFIRVAAHSHTPSRVHNCSKEFPNVPKRFPSDSQAIPKQFPSDSQTFPNLR